MEFNRNQFFMFGILLLLLGVQFRVLESITLSEKTTRFIAARMPTSSETAGANIMQSVGPSPRKVIYPPQWVGWALMSVGTVFILHSLAMKKPGG